MKAIQFSRLPIRIAAAAIAGSIRPGTGAKVGPLRHVDIDEPQLPEGDWVRLQPILAGICGSDLSTIDGNASRYFEPIVSFPFVPGHEVVADTADGERVVLMAVLDCQARGIDPKCEKCAAGATHLCERTAFGNLEAGLQTGFCCDTGGGWSESMVAHRSQLHPVPEHLSDQAAVLIEPTACAVHATGLVPANAKSVAIIGAGTLGLASLAALRAARAKVSLTITAKYPHQKELARSLGADQVVEPRELVGAIRLSSGSMMIGKQLSGGVDCVVDCVGSSESLTQALSVCSPGGTVVVVGMPATTTLDLTSLWHREVTLRGAYAYTRDSFEIATQLVDSAQLERLVSAIYPLARFEEAISHAAMAGRRGATKIVFNCRDNARRSKS